MENDSVQHFVAAILFWAVFQRRETNALKYPHRSSNICVMSANKKPYSII